MFGGVSTSTLCGVQSNNEADAANLNVGDDVNCKVCKKIIAGERKSWRSKFIGLSYEQVEKLAIR